MTEFFRKDGVVFLKLTAGGHGGGVSSDFTTMAEPTDYLLHPVAYARFVASEALDVLPASQAEAAPEPAPEAASEESDIGPSKEA